MNNQELLVLKILLTFFNVNGGIYIIKKIIDDLKNYKKNSFYSFESDILEN